ncbi:MAG: hypothetical protein IJ757_05740 [Clostridiales bacterium]|nr:hypothetical protein [Clostridiales bacterium]
MNKIIRKPYYGKFLVHYLIRIGFVISILLLVLKYFGMIAYIDLFNYRFEQDEKEYLLKAVERLSQIYTEDGFDYEQGYEDYRWRYLYAKYIFASSGEYFGVASQGVIEDETVVDSSFDAIVFSTRNGVFSPYEINDINRAYEINSILADKGYDDYSFIEDRNYELLFYDLYINDQERTFLPGVLEVYLDDELLDTVDLTPEDTSGYERVVPSEDISFTYHKAILFVGGSDTDDSNFLMSSDGETLNIKGDKNRFEVRYTDTFPPHFDRVVRLGTVIGIIAGALITLLLSALIAFIRYMKDKSIYDIFVYRQNMTRTLAHNLKTPLAVIASYAQNISSGVAPENQKEYAQKINDNVMGMKDMINGFLESSGDGQEEI